MNIKAIGSVFLLFTIVTGIIAMSPVSFADYLHPIHPAFADHHEVTITPVSGSGFESGCEKTAEGCFSPNTVTVYVGSVIVFSNTESRIHNFASGGPNDDLVGLQADENGFNTKIMQPGDSATWTATVPGEFPYFDMTAPWMQGLIIVQEGKGITHSEEEPVIVEEEPVIVEEEPVDVEEVMKNLAVVEQVVEESAAPQESSEEGGGCLIATAAYGSELAPQVQMLREIRDNQLMNTESGSAFMTTFNELYYSFSPTIADMERESPVFKEIVKAGLTPMISTLSLMESAETESEVLGLGLSVIALNLGMYIGLPAFGIVKVIQLRKN